MDIRRNIIFATMLIGIGCSFLACDEKDEPINDTLSRLFRPVGFAVKQDIGENITFSWTPIGNATYRLEFSNNQDFTDEAEIVVIPLSNVAEYATTATELGTKMTIIPGVYYYARIKNISNNPDVKDSEYSGVLRFRT